MVTSRIISGMIGYYETAYIEISCPLAISGNYGSTSFQRTVIGHTRELDSSRPVTFVTAMDYGDDKAVSICTLL